MGVEVFAVAACLDSFSQNVSSDDKHYVSVTSFVEKHEVYIFFNHSCFDAHCLLLVGNNTLG